MPGSHIKRIPDTYQSGATAFGPAKIDPSALYPAVAAANGLVDTTDLVFTLTDAAGNTVAQAEQVLVQVFAPGGTTGTVHLFTTGTAGVGSFVFGQASASGTFCISTAATGIASIQMYSGGAGTSNVRWIKAQVVSADGAGGAASLASVSI